MLCGRRLVWHKSISQIFVFFLLGFSIIYLSPVSRKAISSLLSGFRDAWIFCRMRLALPVLTRAQTTVHGHTFYPLRHVGTRDAATDDTLEIDRQVKGHTVYEVGIGNDDILTPLAVGYRLFVHSASKVQSFFLLCSLF